MRLLACGGRQFADWQVLCEVLDGIHAGGRVSVLIHGNAKGADQLARDWAILRGVPVLAFPADWKTHGKAAGPIRNQQMLNEGRPDYVVAFPGGNGTADMIRRSELARVPVIHRVVYPRIG